MSTTHIWPRYAFDAVGVGRSKHQRKLSYSLVPPDSGLCCWLGSVAGAAKGQKIDQWIPNIFMEIETLEREHLRRLPSSHSFLELVVVLLRWRRLIIWRVRCQKKFSSIHEFNISDSVLFMSSKRYLFLLLDLLLVLYFPWVWEYNFSKLSLLRSLWLIQIAVSSCSKCWDSTPQFKILTLLI